MLHSKLPASLLLLLPPKEELCGALPDDDSPNPLAIGVEAKSKLAKGEEKERSKRSQTQYKLDTLANKTPKISL